VGHNRVRPTLFVIRADYTRLQAFRGNFSKWVTVPGERQRQKNKGTLTAQLQIIRLMPRCSQRCSQRRHKAGVLSKVGLPKQERNAMKDIITEYLHYLVLTGKEAHNAQTALDYLQKYTQREQLHILYLGAKDAEHLQESLLARGAYTKATVLNMIGRISSFYDYLYSRKLVLSNPFTGLYRPKRPQSLPRNILSGDETNTLLDSLKDFNREEGITKRRMLYKAHVAAELLYATGMRKGELARLTVSDVDCMHGTVRILDTKANRERTVYMNDYCREILHIYITQVRSYILTERQDKELLFGSSRNLGMWLNALLKERTQELQLSPITVHSFRHNFGMHLLSSGCDIRLIQQMLGHSSLLTTQVYTRVDKHDLQHVLDECHPRSLQSAS
jgi:integrase/recombinase XerD